MHREIIAVRVQFPTLALKPKTMKQTYINFVQRIEDTDYLKMVLRDKISERLGLLNEINVGFLEPDTPDLDRVERHIMIIQNELEARKAQREQELLDRQLKLF